MKTYVQRKEGTRLETVDEFDSKEEARDMLAEYRLRDHSAEYYLSGKPCKAWANRD